MRRFSVQVFDEYIAGTTGAWYTSCAYDDLFGSADSLVIQAITEQVSGGTPNFLIQPQTSCNGLDWVNTVTTLQPPAPIVTDGTYIVDSQFFTWQTFLTYVRLKITLQGSTPACLLKLFVCGRASSNSRPQPGSYSPLPGRPATPQ